MTPDLEFRSWAAAARPRLRRTAFLLCGDWHLAEDLSQDTLVRVHARWRGVSSSGAPDAYARRVLVNAHRATLRRPWRREHSTEVLPDHAQAQAHGSDDRDALLAALAELGQSQRTIVVLRFWEDMSVAQVAEVLGVSTGTVKSQTSRGLERLRSVLTELAEPATARRNS